jgi:Holliday junction resolvase RusA-like endonuclease
MKLTIDYEPTAKGMPRTKFVGGHAITYFNHKTNKALDDIRLIVKENRLKPFPKHTPIKLTVTFYRTKSKWLPKREASPFRKPDLDNFLKLILDTVSGIIVPDDAQFTSIEARKRWSNNGHGYIMMELREDSLDA